MDTQGDAGDKFAFRPVRLDADTVTNAKTSARPKIALILLIGGAVGACAMAWKTSGAPTSIDELLAALVECERRGLVPHTMMSGRTVCYPPASNANPAPPLWPRTPSTAKAP